MSTRLTNFLVHLATNRVVQRQFKASPGSAMSRAKLSADEREAILARDSGRIRKLLGMGPVDTMTQFDADDPKNRPPKRKARKGAKKAAPKRGARKGAKRGKKRG